MFEKLSREAVPPLPHSPPQLLVTDYDKNLADVFKLNRFEFNYVSGGTSNDEREYKKFFGYLWDRKKVRRLRGCLLSSPK